MDARRQRAILQRIAHRAMLDRGLLPDFSAEALAELDRITDPPAGGDGPVRDLRNLPWASIDNDDSRDLDQLTVAETLPGGAVKVLVAVADVDALVKKGSTIDEHARQNTTSVYTAAEIFPMLPEKLSTDLTSLGFQEDQRSHRFILEKRKTDRKGGPNWEIREGVGGACSRGQSLPLHGGFGSRRGRR